MICFGVLYCVGFGISGLRCVFVVGWVVCLDVLSFCFYFAMVGLLYLVSEFGLGLLSVCFLLSAIVWFDFGLYVLFAVEVFCIAWWACVLLFCV